MTFLTFLILLAALAFITHLARMPIQRRFYGEPKC